MQTAIFLRKRLIACRLTNIACIDDAEAGVKGEKR